MKAILLATSLMVLCANATAQDFGLSKKSIRLALSMNNSAFSVRDDGESSSISTTSGEGALTFQSHKGFYGQLGFGKSTSFDDNTNMLGFGYRRALKTPDRYWGLGYRYTDSINSINPLHGIRSFWEKDNTKRYGVIDLSFSGGIFYSTLGVSGQHIWFVNNSLGFGVNWGLGTGILGIGSFQVSTSVANLGAVIMYRPKF